MENMEDFCVSHNYTQRDLLLHRRHPPPALPPPPPSSSATALHRRRRRSLLLLRRRRCDRLLGVLHNISENTVGENHY